MDTVVVHGGNKLNGSVEIEGAKNAALPILAASILGKNKVSKLKNVPLLSDIYTMIEVLEYLNVEIDFDETNKEMTIDSTKELKSDTPLEFMSKMRASIVVMGPLLARNKRARVAMPGGCSIGSRPIDLHLKGFEAMGATIEKGFGYIEATAEQLHGADIYLDFPSVGATQNILMAATMAEGTTTIDNAAREPEIVDLANYLNLMGAKVVGAGTDKIRIQGVKELNGANHSIIRDRIESGTFMVAAAITEGNVFIKNCLKEHNRPLVSKLREMGVTIYEEDDGVRVIGPKKLKPTDIKTQPHPGFPTDMQAQMTIAQLKAEGRSIVQETVFENRFMHLEQLQKMNANVHIDARTAVIYGGEQLHGAEVASTDLRASAALVLAGLISEGQTTVTHIEHLRRGYHEFDKKLSKLGGDVKIVKG